MYVLSHVSCILGVTYYLVAGAVFFILLITKNIVVELERLCVLHCKYYIVHVYLMLYI